MSDANDDDNTSDYQLLIKLLDITDENIDDPDTAYLLVERSLFHFMRLTTTRRNNRQAVSEEELSLALPIAEKIFTNPTLIPTLLLFETKNRDDDNSNNSNNDDDHRDGNDGNFAAPSSSSTSIVESCVLVMLNELLCFIDFSGEDENARKNDPPSFHTRRIQCAINLMKRCSITATRNQELPVSTLFASFSKSLFRSTLPGVASRTIANIATVLNSSISRPSSKAQRESCLYCLKLLRQHLEGCDFQSFVAAKEGLSAFVRVSALCSSSLCEAFKRFLLASVAGRTSSAMTNAWFDSSSSSFCQSFATSAIDLFNFLLGDEFLRTAVTRCGRVNTLSSSTSSSSTSEELEENQKRLIKSTCETLRVNVLQTSVLVARFFMVAHRRGQEQECFAQQLEQEFLQSDKFDQFCFSNGNISGNSNNTYDEENSALLLNLMIFEAATSRRCCAMANYKVTTKTATTRDRFFRQLLSCMSSEIKNDLFPSSSSPAGSNRNNSNNSSSGILEVSSIVSAASSTQNRNYSYSSSSSSQHQQQTLFEKWLTTYFDVNSTSYPLAFLQNLDDRDDHDHDGDEMEWTTTAKVLPSSSIPFLMMVARNATRRGYFFDLCDEKSSLQRESSIRSSLQSWLETSVIPVLEDPHLYSKHHATLLLLVSVFYELVLVCGDGREATIAGPKLKLVSFRKNTDIGDNDDEDFIWSDCWASSIWENIILSPYLRNNSKHWDLCNGIQKRFRSSIGGLLSKIIAVFGCGMGLQVHLHQRRQQQSKNANNKSKKNKSKYNLSVFPDEAERFLLVAVRELLEMASSEFDSTENVLNTSSMNSLKMIAGSFFATSSSSSSPSPSPSPAPSSPLQQLVRHCLPSISETCTRYLSSNSSSNIAVKISNARILHAATLLAVRETQQAATSDARKNNININTTSNATANTCEAKSQELSKSTIMELSPQIQAIGKVCFDVLRKYHTSNEYDSSSSSSSSPSAHTVTLRILLFKIALTITEFTTSAQRAQDQSWNNAVGAYVQSKKGKSLDFFLRKGNIVRTMYKKKILEKEASPGQVNLMPSSDDEWMETEDFTAFVEPFVARLHENAIQLLGCAVASLSSEYYYYDSSSADSTTPLRRNHDSSLLRIGGDSRAMTPLLMLSSSSPSTSTSGDLISVSKDAIFEKRKAEVRRKATFSSVAERIAAIHLAVSCLASVSTTTPTTYFDVDHSQTMTSEGQNEEKDNDEQQDAASPSSVSVAASSSSLSATNKQELILAGAQKLRVSRNHWTSVFKLFHALQSLLLSSSLGSNGFRDIQSAINFFFNFATTLFTLNKKNQTKASDNTISKSNSNNNNEQKLRIEVKNHVQTIKNSKLIADESIAHTFKAFEFLVSAAPVFLLYRTQTEVLPLLALHWLTLCQEQEPEIWSRVILSGGRRCDEQDDAPTVQRPRTQLGKKFLTAFTMLKTTCGVVSEDFDGDIDGREQKSSKDSTLPTPDDDVKKVARCLQVFGL